MGLRVSVANKGLMVLVNPLDATLTKNRGVPPSSQKLLSANVSSTFRHPVDRTFRRSRSSMFQRALASFFSLFAQRVLHNSFAITGIRTLSRNSRDVGYSSDSGRRDSLLNDRRFSAGPLQHGSRWVRFFADVTHSEDARRVRVPGSCGAGDVAHFFSVEGEGRFGLGHR